MKKSSYFRVAIALAFVFISKAGGEWIDCGSSQILNVVIRIVGPVFFEDGGREIESGTSILDAVSCECLPFRIVSNRQWTYV
mgnify:FL=1